MERFPVENEFVFLFHLAGEKCFQKSAFELPLFFSGDPLGEAY